MLSPGALCPDTALLRPLGGCGQKGHSFWTTRNKIGGMSICFCEHVPVISIDASLNVWEI